jgi:EmrB/QacA subfamily drug resistance transporter
VTGATEIDSGQAAARTRVDPLVWKVALVALLGPLMAQMDSTIVNVSLSTIQESLHASLGAAQWIVTGYLLALALMLPLNGWLVDRLGAKRLYLGCFSAFTLTSVLCGACHTIGGLIAARVAQGIAGGLLAPMTQMMIAKVAGKQMARVMGYTAMPVLLAPLLGPVVAGAILEWVGWPWLFYINLPVGLLAVVLAAVLLPKDEAGPRRRPFDFTGFLLISPGLAISVYSLERVAHGDGWGLLLVGLSLVGAFVWHAWRKDGAALVDLRLFGNSVFATATATQCLSNSATFAGQMLIPMYLIAGCRVPAAHAGWLLAPMGVGMLCVYPSLGYLTDRFGCRALASGGTLLTLLATLPLLWMSQSSLSPLLLGVALLARGAGQGAIGVPSVSAGYASVPREHLAQATTAANIAQRLGGPLGATLMAIVLSLPAAQVPAAGPHGFSLGFLALLGLQIILLVSASRLPDRIHPAAPGGAEVIPSSNAR